MSKQAGQQRYYTFAEEFLVGQARRGDMTAQTVLEHRRAVQRMCTETKEASAPRDHCCCLTGEVRLHFRKSRKRPGHVQMFLDIGEITSFEAIKKQWEEILTWQGLLLEWQGPSPSGRNGFFYRLHLDQRQGQSYATIAARLNASIHTALETYVKGNAELRQAVKTGMIRTTEDLIQWQQTTQSDPSELDLVQQTLKKCGFMDNEIKEWCLGTLENSVSEGGNRYRELLFTRNWVISKLRNWRAKNQLWLTTVDKAPHRIPNT